MKALLMVDIQNDFLPGGALAVPAGDAVVEIANLLSPHFACVLATQDWHPQDHASFANNHAGKAPGDIIDLDGLSQILWPQHCVQNTGGALFSPGLQTASVERVFPKGTNPRIDSYSGFFDNGRRQATELANYLKCRGVVQLCVLGLATDYCVKATALDAQRLGFETILIEDGCRGVNLKPGDVSYAYDEMESAGVRIITSTQLLAELRE